VQTYILPYDVVTEEAANFTHCHCTNQANNTNNNFATFPAHWYAYVYKILLHNM